MGNDVISVVKVGDILMVAFPGEPDDVTITAMQEKVLEAMIRHDPAGVVIDVSTVEVLDSFFARAIVETAKMASLMGGRTVIAGMRPSVAITAIQLGLAFEGLETAMNADRALKMLAGPAPGTGGRGHP